MSTSPQFYPKALQAFLSGAVDLTTATIKVQLVDADYTFDDAHDFLDDVTSGARIGSPVTLTTPAVSSAGVFTADDVTFPTVTAGDTVTGFIVYKHTGTESTSRLLAYCGRQSAGRIPISIVTDGGDIIIDWPAGVVFKLQAA